MSRGESWPLLPFRCKYEVRLRGGECSYTMRLGRLCQSSSSETRRPGRRINVSLVRQRDFIGPLTVESSWYDKSGHLVQGSDSFENARQITLRTFGHVLLWIAVVCISWFVCQFFAGVVLALLAMFMHNLPPNLVRNGARFFSFVFFVIGIYIIAMFYFRGRRN